MIDKKVFDELMNRGVITNVGLNPDNYKNIDDLQRYGLATGIDADIVYETAVEQILNRAEVLNKFLADVAAGGTVVLPMSFNLTAPIIIEKDVTIDLNGNCLYGGLFGESGGNVVDGDSDSYVFWVKKGTLTINGNGNIATTPCKYSIAVWANGGNVIINGGEYTNGNGCDLIYLSGKSNVEINDGVFNAAINDAVNGTKNKRSAINIKDKDRATCKVSVKGGKFLEFDPANNLSEGENTNFLVDGYESIAEGDYFIVREANDIIVDDEQ